MTTSTMDHADYSATPAVTPVDPQLSLEDAPQADESLARVLNEARVPVHPDPGAPVRYARVLYGITGWEVFREQAEAADEAGYITLAAEHAAEDAERRQIARRRPPSSADEE